MEWIFFLIHFLSTNCFIFSLPAFIGRQSCFVRVFMLQISHYKEQIKTANRVLTRIHLKQVLLLCVGNSCIEVVVSPVQPISHRILQLVVSYFETSTFLSVVLRP